MDQKPPDGFDPKCEGVGRFFGDPRRFVAVVTFDPPGLKKTRFARNNGSFIGNEFKKNAPEIQC